MLSSAKWESAAYVLGLLKEFSEVAPVKWLGECLAGSRHSQSE